VLSEKLERELEPIRRRFAEARQIGEEWGRHREIEQRGGVVVLYSKSACDDRLEPDLSELFRKRLQKFIVSAWFDTSDHRDERCRGQSCSAGFGARRRDRYRVVREDR